MERLLVRVLLGAVELCFGRLRGRKDGWRGSMPLPPVPSLLGGRLDVVDCRLSGTEAFAFCEGCLTRAEGLLADGAGRPRLELPRHMVDLGRGMPLRLEGRGIPDMLKGSTRSANLDCGQ
jgi:hypothetical protein